MSGEERWRGVSWSASASASFSFALLFSHSFSLSPLMTTSSDTGKTVTAAPYGTTPGFSYHTRLGGARTFSAASASQGGSLASPSYGGGLARSSEQSVSVPEAWVLAGRGGLVRGRGEV